MTDGVVRVLKERARVSGVAIESADKIGPYNGVVSIKGKGLDSVRAAVGNGAVVSAEACPVVVGAVEHILVLVLGHNSEAVRLVDTAIHHIVGAVDKGFRFVIGVGVTLGEVEGAALRNEHGGDVYLRVFLSKGVNGVRVSGASALARKEVLQGVVAADEHRPGVVGVNIVVIVTAVGLGDYSGNIVRKVAAPSGGDVFLSLRNDPLAAGAADAVGAHVMAFGGSKLLSADKAELGLGTGCLSTRGVLKLRRELKAALRAYLGLGAGGGGTRNVTRRFNKDFAAVGTDLGLGTGCGGTGSMFMTAGGKPAHQQN